MKNTLAIYNYCYATTIKSYVVRFRRIVQVRSHSITICKTYKAKEIYHSFEISPAKNTTQAPPPHPPPCGPLPIPPRFPSSLASVTLPRSRGVGSLP